MSHTKMRALALLLVILYSNSPFVLFSSPEHVVLMVSYCGQSMSVVRRQQFVLKANCIKLHWNVA